MARKALSYDSRLLVVTSLLVFTGLLTLFSASLGHETPTPLYSGLLVQGIGVILGVLAIAGALFYRPFDYRCLYKKHYAVYFFLLAILIQLLVFSPLGLERNGAWRWLDLQIITIQPSELLKIAMVLLLGSLLVGYRKKLGNLRTVILLCLGTVGVVSILMLLIRDKGTLIIAALAAFSMLLVARITFWKLCFLACLGSASLVGFILFSGSYAEDRLVSFLGFEPNPLGADYQVNQSIMTIGSGEIFGKGLGNSIQKYEYLPEPLTDSIFAIYAEEWGFVGSCFLILLYVLFLLVALRIATQAKDAYGTYIVVGLAMLIFTQSLLNIMALVKLVPLSGMPLVFISKGGTSMASSLCIVAIIMNVSRVSQSGFRRIARK